MTPRWHRLLCLPVPRLFWALAGEARQSSDAPTCYRLAGNSNRVGEVPLMRSSSWWRMLPCAEASGMRPRDFLDVAVDLEDGCMVGQARGAAANRESPPAQQVVPA